MQISAPSSMWVPAENSIRRDTYYGMGLLIGQTSGGEISQFGWNLVGGDVFKICLDQQCGSGSHYDGQQQDYLRGRFPAA